MANNTANKYLSTAQLAERLGVKPDKVVRWIKSGELRAVNVAADTAKRPLWRIPPDAVIEFEEKRRGGKKAAKKRRGRRRKKKAVTRHFD